MFQVVFVILIILLPLVESLNRQAGFNLLLVGAVLTSFTLLKKSIALDFSDKLFILFLIGITISTLFSVSYGRSFSELLRYFSYFAILIGLKNSTSLTIRRNLFVYSTIIASVLLIIASMVTAIPWLRNSIGMKVPTSGMNLFYPVFGHNRISDILLFSVPIAFALIKIHKGKTRAILFCLSIIFAGMLLYSFSRAGLAALLLSGFIVGSASQKFLKPMGIITVLFLIISVVYSNFIADPKISGTIPKGIYKPFIFEKRAQYWDQAARSIIEKPFLGWGLDTFRYTSLRLQKEPVHWSWYTHNHFLELVSEVGIPAGILFIIYISWVIRTLIHAVRAHNGISAAILVGLFASTLHSLVDYDWQFYSVLLYAFTEFALFPRTHSNRFSFDSTRIVAAWVAVFVVLVLLKWSFPSEGEAFIKKAQREEQGSTLSQPITTLLRGTNVDNANYQLYMQLGRLFEQNGNFIQAHKQYDTVLFLNPLESFEIVKRDFKLYLKEAQTYLESGNINDSAASITNAYTRYPYIHREMHFNSYLADFDDLRVAFKRTEASAIIEEYLTQSTAKIDEVGWVYR